MLGNDIRAEPKAVTPLDPSGVAAVVELRVVAEIGHEVVLGADHGKAADLELRPATLESPRAVGSRNTQDIRT